MYLYVRKIKWILPFTLTFKSLFIPSFDLDVLMIAKFPNAKVILYKAITVMYDSLPSVENSTCIVFTFSIVIANFMYTNCSWYLDGVWQPDRTMLSSVCNYDSPVG